MSLTRDDVDKVSLLARLLLTADELEQMTGQLTQIVGYVEQPNELDTTHVQPLSHPADCSNVFRDDTPRGSMGRDEVLANAPHTDGEFYLVPAVLGE